MKTVQQAKQTTTSSAPQSGSRAPFFSPVVQPKLTINQPNDVYEQEADAVADKVMRMPEPTAQNEPFFKPAPSALQRKCSHCAEEEKKLHLKPNPMPVQRKCSECEEEEKLHRKETGHEATSSNSSLESYVGSLSGGQPLSNESRSFFEPRFGYDFSDVRTHNDASANASAAGIQAKAYTHGSNIVFGSGEYSETTAGTSLLAHELTHVVQQTNGVNRKNFIQRAGVYWMPESKGGSDVHNEVLEAIGHKNSAKNIFSEAPVPNGTAGIGDIAGTGKIGYADLMMTNNGNLVGVFKTGEGMLSNIGDIKRLEKQIILNGKKFSRDNLDKRSGPHWNSTHQKVSDTAKAPATIEIADLKPYEKTSITDGFTQLGNYKTGIGEVSVQVNQLIAKGAADSTTPWSPSVEPLKNLDIPDKYQFPAASGQHSKDLKITFGFVRGLLNKLKETGSLKILSEYEKIRSQNIMPGKLYVVEHKDGIYTYAYIPDAYTNPAAMAKLTGAGGLPSTSPFSDMMTLVETDIKGKLKGTSFVAKKQDDAAKNQNYSTSGSDHIVATNESSTAKPATSPKPVQRSPKKIQRKETEYKDTFDQKEWDKSLETYQGKFTESLKTKEMRQLITYGDNVAGYDDMRKSLPKAKMPALAADEEKPASQLKSLEVWTYPGVGVLGTFRRLFGRAFVGVINTYEHVKEKIKNIAKKKDGGSVSSVAAAAIRIIVKVIKLIANYVVSQSLSLLIESLKKGVADNLKALYESLMPDELQKYIDEFMGIREKYEEMAGKTIEKWKRDFFGSWIDDYEKIQDLIDKIQPIAGMVEKLVRWGAGIIACLSPPAIGCLWNIFKEIGMYFIAKIIQTCWFGTKVMGFLVDNFPQIMNLSRTIANGIKGFANDHIPLPFGMKPLFADIPEPDAKNYSMECGEFEGGGGGDGSGGDRGEVYDMINEIGEEKFKAFLEMMRKRGAGDWVLLTPERLRGVKDDLMKTSVDDLNKLAAGEKPAEGVSVSIEDLLKDIQKYTPREEKVKKDYFDEKKRRDAEKAAKAEAAAGGGSGQTTTVDSSSGGGSGGKAGPKKTMGEKATKTSTQQNVQFAANVYSPAFGASNIPKESVSTTVFVFYKDDPSAAKYEYYFVDDVKMKVKEFDGSLYTFINEEDFSVEFKPGVKHFFKKGLEIRIRAKFVEFK